MAPRYLGGLIFVLALVISSGWLVISRPWSGQAEPPAETPQPGG